jgi:hypothetical protein
MGTLQLKKCLNSNSHYNANKQPNGDTKIKEMIKKIVTITNQATTHLRTSTSY